MTVRPLDPAVIATDRSGLTEHVAVEPRGDACTLMAAAAELHGIAAVGMSRAS